MAQFYHLSIGQSELDDQRALLGKLISLLVAGHPATVTPSDQVSQDALIGLQNLLDTIADQGEPNQ